MSRQASPSSNSLSPLDSDDEMDRLMSQARPTPPPLLPDSEPDAHVEGEGNMPASSTSGTGSVSLHHVGIPRNELVAIRNACKRAKLHPYQQQEVEEHYTLSPAHRHAQLLTAILALNNKTESLIASTPGFTVSSHLLHNIKSFIIAVLLSSKLGSYKGVCPRDHVLALVMRDRFHIPKTFERDPSASKALKEVVNHELSQARSKLKKMIAANLELNVYELATMLIDQTSCTVSVPLCGRIALFRKVILVNPGSDFWDAVDAQLKKLRTKATNKQTKVLDQAAINQYFTNILDLDLDAYPSESDAIVPTNLLPTDEWQLSVDNMISGEPQATLPAGPAA